MAAVTTSDPSSSVRILHVFRAPVGGLFRHVSDLARLQAAAGHEVGIVCDSTTGGAQAERALAALAPHLALGVRRLPMRRNPHLSDRTALLAVRDRAAEVGADVLHGHGAKGGVYARIAPSRSPVIRAYTPHGGSYNYRPGSALHRLYMAAEGLLARRTDVFLFESHYVAGCHRTFVGGPERITRIVHNGIGEAEFAPLTPAADRFDLLYVGELREAKGLPFLLDAFARMRAQGRALRLLMVGSGPDEASLRAATVEMGIADAVAFEPSLAESLPYVVLEAAAAAQPLVATDVGGMPEIFGSAADRLVPARDAGALAEAIAAVLDEPSEQREPRFRALSDSVRLRFSLDRMGADVLSGYAAALRARSRNAAPVGAPETA